MTELETFFTVSQQIRLLLGAVMLGVPLGFCFDVLRCIRMLVPHGKFATALEDSLFLLLWGGVLICYAYAFARGEFRGYYVLGSILGFLLYCCTLGVLIIPLLRRILAGIGKSIRWTFKPVFRGIVRICTALTEEFGHFAKLFRKPALFLRLLLIRNQKMLYNKKEQRKREATRKWLGKRQMQNPRKARNLRKNHAGSFGSSAGQR